VSIGSRQRSTTNRQHNSEITESTTLLQLSFYLKFKIEYLKSVFEANYIQA